MDKIIILSTDTLHHRYFINRLIKNGIGNIWVFFERESVQPLFEIGPFYTDEEHSFEAEQFLINTSQNIDKINITVVNNINFCESVDLLKRLSPDLGIVFGTRKLSADVIDIFQDGLINVHRGISQEYRGVDSGLWAIYHDDYNNIGVTIHKVDKELDTGEIIFQERLQLKKDMQIYQLRYYTTVISTELVIKALYQYISHGSFISYPQHKKGRYYSFMPLSLKQFVNKKFIKHCQKLNE